VFVRSSRKDRLKNTHKQVTHLTMGKSTKATKSKVTSSKTEGITKRDELTTRGFPPRLLSDEKGTIKPESRLEELLREQIWVLHDFLSAAECRAWVDYLEESGT
jgi:hypothetical protein